jgi:hypothetical protein
VLHLGYFYSRRALDGASGREHAAYVQSFHSKSLAKSWRGLAAMAARPRSFPDLARRDGSISQTRSHRYLRIASRTLDCASSLEWFGQIQFGG